MNKAIQGFFVIKIYHPIISERGYIMDTPKGIKLVTDSPFLPYITRFDTRELAREFVRKHRLEHGKRKAIIQSNEDLMKDEELRGKGVTTIADRPMYYLENAQGEKLVHDMKNGYSFRNVAHGYCCWYSHAELKDFVDNKMDFGEPTFIKTMLPKDTTVN